MKKTKEKENGKWVPAQGYYRKILARGKDLRSDNNLVQMIAVPSGSRVEPHYHKKTSEFIYVVTGEAQMYVNEEIHEMTPGRHIILHPGDVHAVVNDHNEAFVVLVVKINMAENDSYWVKKSS